MNELTAAWLARQSAVPGAIGAIESALGRSDLLATAYGRRYLNRPVFLERAEHEKLGADLRAYYELACQMPDRLCGGDVGRFGRLVGMEPVQLTALERCRADRPPLSARADLYQSDGRFKVLEYNIHSALGGFEIAEVNRLALEDPTLAAFVANRGLDYVDTLARIVGVMFDALAGADLPSRPSVAIVDWPTSFVSLERRLQYMAKLMGPLGIDAVACHPGHMRSVGDRLYVGDRAVDVVWRFFLIEDLLESPEAPALLEPIFRAHERGSAIVYTGFDAELIGNKRLLAVLSEPATRELLSGEERALVDRLAPWTRRLGGPTVERGGEELDAVDLLRAERERLILKPNLMTGGTGVAPGWAMPAEEWDGVVATAVRGGYIVQERVVPDAEPFLSEDGQVVDWALNWGVFCLGDGYGGAIMRATPDRNCGVISMGNGARIGSCFHEV